MSPTEDFPAPDRQTELSDAALDWLNSTFARTVALKLTPVLLPVLGAIAVWLQDAIGINMDPAVAAAFVVSVVIGTAATIVVYVRNHGRGAAMLGQASLELEKLYEAGNVELARADSATTVNVHGGGFDSDPTTPPGLSDRT
jgi:hypothetical protein